ncbi:MAG: histidine kinase [Micrococcales bacterium]|nr:histidine kinase [Micrococcales bacterium]
MTSNPPAEHRLATVRRAVLGGAVVVLVWVAALVLVDRSQTFARVVVTVLAVVLGIGAYRVSTMRRMLADRDAELVRARDEHAEAEVRAERTRIARELHDVVAHHISGIVLRADAADLVADDNPDEPRQAVKAIADAGREALDAVRSVVRMLRDPADVVVVSTQVSDAAWHPTDTIAELPAVVARVAAAGLQVDAHLPDPLPRLGAAAELAVVRVAAEALTNVLLHSQATRAELWLDVVDDRLQLGIADPGPPTPDDESSGGHGLMHMRERAASAAGTLEAGPDWPGWLVVLEVPIGAPSPETEEL